MSILKGNRAVKIDAETFTLETEKELVTKENYIFWHMLNTCQSYLDDQAKVKNIDLLEYNILFSEKCSKYEKLYYHSLRTRMREKMYNDQIKEYSSNYDGIYHPYNPYLQKLNGAYLRSYQIFH